MAPVTGSIETHGAFNADLVRKTLTGAVLLSPWPARTEITTLIGTAGAIIVPDDYKSVGRISEDGATFAKDVNTSEIMGWGSATFVRRDVQSVDQTLQFSALESKAITKQLSLGITIPTQMTSTGELAIDIPDRPPVQYWGVLVIGSDGSGSSAFHMAKWYPKMNVTELDDETWAAQDDGVYTNVTMGAALDEDAGVTCREFWFGPGVLSRAVDMGFTVAT